MDWLGSERVRTNATGTLLGAFESLPFGDGLTTLTGTDTDTIHYTGKERDTANTDANSATGLDYFGARFLSSEMGRFMSPDDSGNDPGPVPYADFTNPQSMNLYAYVNDNPLSNIDSDGHLGTSDTSAALAVAR